MKVYVFGNIDHPEDNLSFKTAALLQKEHKDIDFIFVQPNEDVPFVGEERVVILDVVQGIDIITVIDEKQLHNLILSPRNTVHDMDLAFQLRYLKKLGKLHKISIIGLPYGKEVDYDSLHSILRKLVAQDIQGS
ncbi:MAG: hypothetical protein Q7S61_04215 [bacterium]|nr:hypothetical protein [bacterium]